MTIIDRQLVDQERAWHQLRAERFEQLTQPYSVLAQTGLHWLDESPQRLGNLPGEWYVDQDHAVVIADEGDSLRRPVTEESITGTLRLSVPEAGAVVVAEIGPRGPGAGRLEVIKRTGSYAVRSYDPAAPARTRFHGIPSYPFDAGWVVSARFHRYDQSRPITVHGAQPGLRHDRIAVGDVRFVREGAEHSLIVFGDHGTTILFSDITSGAESAPWRILPVIIADDSSEVILDFNRAVNLPYAFNDFGTCPQPPEGNHLDLAVTAGELVPERIGPISRSAATPPTGPLREAQDEVPA
jgi:uncharacterized protein (DUF1684 family)